METTYGAMGVLHGDVFGGLILVGSVLVVHWERSGKNRTGDHRLDREVREL